MMKYLFTTAALLASLCLSAQKPAASTAKPVAGVAKGRNIQITLTPIKNAKIYLGSYFGESKALMDSAYLDENSRGVFKGDTKLTGGVYFVVTAAPAYSMQFEFLMDNKQQFSIVADTAFKGKEVITGSPDNDLFRQYSSVLSGKGAKLGPLYGQLAAAKTKADSAQVLKEIGTIDKEMQDYRDEVMKKNPNSMLSVLLNAMRRPDVPAIPVVNGKRDSSYPYRYVKEHYWDHVMFNDDRLLRTPFFEKKLNEYMKSMVSPEPDSIIGELKYILLSARTGKEMYPYLLTKFTNKYMNPEFMGQDKVFVWLYENFYAKGDTLLLNPASRKAVTERAYSLMANQIGLPAPQLVLTDSLGKPTSLYGIEGTFTIVAFWDPNCGHCKEEIPRLDSFYEAKWKNYGVKVFSVNIYNNNLPEWKHFIAEKKLGGWIHCYQTAESQQSEARAGRINYRQAYDIQKTPTLYLLDKDKRIIAKQLSLEQFDDLIEAKRKTK